MKYEHWISKVVQVHSYAKPSRAVNMKIQIGTGTFWQFNYDNEYKPHKLCYESPEGQILPLFSEYVCQEPSLGHLVYISQNQQHDFEFYISEVQLFAVEGADISGLTFTWLGWSSWSECLAPCGGSSHSRQRERPCQSAHSQYGSTATITRLVDGIHCENTFAGEAALETESCGSGA